MRIGGAESTRSRGFADIRFSLYAAYRLWTSGAARLLLREAGKSLPPGEDPAKTRGWPGGAGGVRKAGMGRRRPPLAVVQSGQSRGSGPHPIRRFAPAELGKGSAWQSPRLRLRLP